MISHAHTIGNHLQVGVSPRATRMRIYISLPHPFFVFELSGGKTMADKKTQGARDCNVVAQERIWEEAVHREANAAKQW